MEPTDYAIITKQQYEGYAAAWKALIETGNSDSITQVFQPAGMKLLTVATFSLPQVVALMSTVGMRSIFASFLYRQGEAPAGQSDFTVALSALDHDFKEISAWYAGTTTLVPADDMVGAEIPADLAAIWQSNWEGAPPLAADMFHTKGQVLEGYIFPVSDFLDPLLAAQPFEGSTLKVSFGLHSGFAHTEGDAPPQPLQTFGLLVQITNPQGKQVAPFYDLSHPCPPMHG